MTRAALLMFALAGALVGGVLAGSAGRRALERAALPPRRLRPPLLEAALRAAQAGDAQAAAAALRELGPTPGAEDAAEAALARALAGGAGDAALLGVAREHDGTDAAARALWLLAERAPDPATRRRRRAAFAARWPDAWVLATGAR